MRETIRPWLPHLLQSLVLLSAAYAYAVSQEHRFTVLEESMKVQHKLVERQQTQLEETQRTLQRLVLLEEFIHRTSKGGR